MLHHKHAKFQDHRTSGSGEDFKGFYHIWAWRPSWSCDLDHLYKHSFPIPKEAISEKMFENNGHIQVYSPGAEAENPLGYFFFLFINTIIDLFSQFSPFPQVFPN